MDNLCICVTGLWMNVTKLWHQYENFILLWKPLYSKRLEASNPITTPANKAVDA